jgi:hypothetical protein
MSRMVAVGIIVVMLLAVSAAGEVQIPRGYEIVQLTETPEREMDAAINNHGQCVFVARLGTDHLSDEILLYSDGEFLQLTDDDVRDAYPDINDDGTIVWSRGIGPDGPYGPTLEIVMWQDGDLTRLTDDGVSDYGPKINSLGHVVWSQLIRGGCYDVNAVIRFYDGSTIGQISDADWSHQMPVINDDDWIAWTRYDFCQEPWWDADIMLYVPGEEPEVISPVDAFGTHLPTINNLGQVAWQFEIGRGDKGIQLWEDGVVTLFTDWGVNPRLNDRGDMCFIRWYDDTETWQAWLYLKRSLYQLSDDPFWNTDGDINNAGEAVWESGDSWWMDLRLLRRVPPDATDAAPKLEPPEVRPVDP